MHRVGTYEMVIIFSLIWHN